ncbi:Pyrophosphate-energized vacuolar membrane proton pump [Hibiscus syriacus]|uniref:H(+)-exporting diphosphatase n=1 Tax=Hibiscus syriacus TaxID=106335 RepID=A0A6A3CBA3_HIBSY|nr:Pyrophosphate-energized vacuolar membrane proton pump [Hibiscus syriacus]
MVAFAILIFLFLGSVEGFSSKSQPCTYDKSNICKAALATAAFSTISFLLSVVYGFLGMKIATYANARTTLEARKGAITGYGLGGSSMALFGRVGGGIYTKAADVGANLVGKVERNIPEDDPRNPALIADNVGDNVGDIAGMGSDLFGCESSCIVGCLITTLFATDFFEIKTVKEIEPALKRQLIISTILMTIAIGIATIFVRCCWSLGWPNYWFVTEYYTSNAYSPVQDGADSCRIGAATNVIFGLALGYKSCIIPIFAIAVSIFVSFSFAAMYGIAVAALGMLSTVATGLAIDAYGPIGDNAGGIAQMAGMSHRIRERTDALDAAGNTTAAIGKGFAIGSAALVSLALFGAFVSCASISTCGRCSFEDGRGSAQTVQLNPWSLEGTAKPDYATCVKISTDASIKEMIPPGALVMLTPLVVGNFFSVETLSGVLLDYYICIQHRGAWDNAKKYIEAGASSYAKSLGPKGSDPHKAAVIGDTIGDPLKDTSGPSLNILIKLMAVESLVFASFFATHGGLLFKTF